MLSGGERPPAFGSLTHYILQAESNITSRLTRGNATISLLMTKVTKTHDACVRFPPVSELVSSKEKLSAGEEPRTF